jgi:hypothetical protein
MTTGGVGPSPSIIGALVSSTSNIRSSGIVHLNHSELWYRPPQSFGALVSSTSIIGALVSSTSIVRSSGIVHLNRSELWYRPSQLSEVWAKCPPQSELWYRPPHWLARVYPPASPRVDLVRVHSPSDPVMTSHIGPALHNVRDHPLRWCDTGINLISLFFSILLLLTPLLLLNLLLLNLLP